MTKDKTVNVPVEATIALEHILSHVKSSVARGPATVINNDDIARQSMISWRDKHFPDICADFIMRFGEQILAALQSPVDGWRDKALAEYSEITSKLFTVIQMLLEDPEGKAENILFLQNEANEQLKKVVLMIPDIPTPAEGE